MSTSFRDNVALDPQSFRVIADLAYRTSGLTLVEEKTPMIQSRLRQRLKDLGLPDFKAYCALVESDDGGAERGRLISALTTNVSHFFREQHHFETLQNHFSKKLPLLRQGGQMRIWSAGCSNGQEPYSAAMTLHGHCADLAALDVRILATDIDTEVVSFARAGIYPERLVAGVSPQDLGRYFAKDGTPGDDATFEVLPQLKELITFNELNLLTDWPMKKKFDVIFCRNVVIYFDLQTQEKLWPRFYSALAPDGVLFLGHSERIADPSAFGFTCVGPTTYVKKTA